jgi:hypothetical protein
MNHTDVNNAELVLAALQDRHETHRDAYRSTPAAREICDMYNRCIYTDRGEYPTQKEFDGILAKYATGLVWNDRTWKWAKAA